MHVSITSSFADDLTYQGVRATILSEIQDLNLFRLPNNLVQNTSLPHREIVFTRTSNAACKLCKGNLASVTDWKKGHQHLPARVG